MLNIKTIIDSKNNIKINLLFNNLKPNSQSFFNDITPKL